MRTLQRAQALHTPQKPTHHHPPMFVSIDRQRLIGHLAFHTLTSSSLLWAIRKSLGDVDAWGHIRISFLEHLFEALLHWYETLDTERMFHA